MVRCSPETGGFFQQRGFLLKSVPVLEHEVEEEEKEEKEQEKTLTLWVM